MKPKEERKEGKKEGKKERKKEGKKEGKKLSLHDCGVLHKSERMSVLTF
jgi:hypothetical protein